MGELIPSGTTVDQLHKAKGQATPAKPEPVEYTGDYFKTVIKNNRDGDVMLQDDRGGNWIPIPPGKEIVLCSWSSRTMYCPFSKIVFEKNGKTSVTKRFNFPDPLSKAPYVLELDNRDGGPQEVVQINGEYVSAIRGIPRRVAIPLHDNLVVYKAIVWCKKTVKVPAPANKNYLITREIVEKVLVPRRKSEIVRIKRLMQAEAMAEAKRLAEERFKGVVGAEETDDGAEVPSTEL